VWWPSLHQLFYWDPIKQIVDDMGMDLDEDIFIAARSQHECCQNSQLQAGIKPTALYQH